MLIIDRFEGEWVVIEDDCQSFRIPRKLLPAEAGEGDALDFRIKVDNSSTVERQKKITRLADSLFTKEK